MWLSVLIVSKCRLPATLVESIGSIVVVLGQILGLQPGMVRAREYVSLDVSERLHMLHRRQQTRRTKAVVTSGASTQESAEVSLQAADGENQSAWGAGGAGVA